MNTNFLPVKFPMFEKISNGRFLNCINTSGKNISLWVPRFALNNSPIILIDQSGKRNIFFSNKKENAQNIKKGVIFNEKGRYIRQKSGKFRINKSVEYTFF